MTSTAFAFLLTGVLLNAGAQLLLKAGTNVMGVISLTRENWWDMLWKMGTQAHFIAGLEGVRSGLADAPPCGKVRLNSKTSTCRRGAASSRELSCPP